MCRARGSTIPASTTVSSLVLALRCPRSMTVVPWRPRQQSVRRTPKTNPAPMSWLPVGSYAGRARFRPSERAVLTPALKRAIGQVIEVGFAGIAEHNGPFAGEALYLEWRRDEVLDGFLIPEQDLEFLD